MYNKILTLGIETSCDETGVALYNNKSGIISEYVYSQTVHYEYGGTVPELASRDHIKNLSKLVTYTLKKTKVKFKDLNCISYTKGPGLKGSLLVGSSFSKSLGLSLSIPVIGINHLEAHLLIAFLFNKIKFPCLCFIVSGAHTISLRLESYKTFYILGESLDDGAGEVFDKVARALKLIPFNGISIENICKKKFKFKNLKLPKPFYNSNCLNFSFSGLKTSVINQINNQNYNIATNKPNIAYNFQNTIIKSLLDKCKILINNSNFKSILLSGGVSSNKEFRLDFNNFSKSIGLEIYFSPIRYCVDNGAMVAFLGFLKLLENNFDNNLLIDIFTRSHLNV